MSVRFTEILLTQSKLHRAVRESMQALNETLRDKSLRLTDWPIERPGCLYALSVTLEPSAGGQELGECRFTIDWRGEVYFDADDAPLAPCAPQQIECEKLLGEFVVRRMIPLKSRSAA